MDYDELKELLKELFLKKAMEDHPAEIVAKRENDNINLRFNGRKIDILALSLDIAEKAAKRCNASCDDFCEMLKKGWDYSDCTYESKFEEVFGDLFEE